MFASIRFGFDWILLFWLCRGISEFDLYQHSLFTDWPIGMVYYRHGCRLSSQMYSLLQRGRSLLGLLLGNLLRFYGTYTSNWFVHIGPVMKSFDFALLGLIISTSYYIDFSFYLSTSHYIDFSLLFSSSYKIFWGVLPIFSAGQFCWAESLFLVSGRIFFGCFARFSRMANFVFHFFDTIISPHRQAGSTIYPFAFESRHTVLLDSSMLVAQRLQHVPVVVHSLTPHSFNSRSEDIVRWHTYVFGSLDDANMKESELLEYCICVGIHRSAKHPFQDLGWLRSSVLKMYRCSHFPYIPYCHTAQSLEFFHVGDIIGCFLVVFSRCLLWFLVIHVKLCTCK